MCGYLDSCFPGNGWDMDAHRYLKFAGTGSAQVPFLPSLFSGVSGLGFVASNISRKGHRYGVFLKNIDDALVPHVRAQASRLSRLDESGIPVGSFDLISGLTGFGVYLSCRKGNSHCEAALREVLSALITLAPYSERPRWYTPPDQLTENMRSIFPGGNLNCGLAHGIPGPLSLLSLCYDDGIRVDGLRETIGCWADWLTRQSVTDSWGINWPTTVPVASDSSTVNEPSRAAWCYGSPGVARSLWLAGRALKRQEYQDLAVSAMEAVFRRPVAKRHIPAPTFCHGTAGLLQVSLRFHHDTALPQFRTAVQSTVEQLISAYDRDSLLGFTDVEPGNRCVDNPGLLNGAAGTVMSLLAAVSTIEPSWDRFFLLA